MSNCAHNRLLVQNSLQNPFEAIYVFDFLLRLFVVQAVAKSLLYGYYNFKSWQKTGSGQYHGSLFIDGSEDKALACQWLIYNITVLEIVDMVTAYPCTGLNKWLKRNSAGFLCYQ